MKIYTKKGDGGKTKLFGGKEVYKDDIRVEAYGNIDELNAWMGLLAQNQNNRTNLDFLVQIQHHLFAIGAVLASVPGKDDPGFKTNENVIRTIEEEIDRLQESLPELRNFILPGGHHAVAICHLARTVCRRAERKVVSLSKKEDVDQLIIIFLNRLSDYLFVIARKMGSELGIEEIKWDRERLC
jgi:cob(I)alamin adenosyltransferase